jgi:hypothetical protein
MGWRRIILLHSPICLANLRQAAQSIDFAQLMDILEWQTPDAANDLVSVNTAPDEALLIAEDEAIIFQFVPVTCAADAIAAPRRPKPLRWRACLRAGIGCCCAIPKADGGGRIG